MADCFKYYKNIPKGEIRSSVKMPKEVKTQN